MLKELILSTLLYTPVVDSDDLHKEISCMTHNVYHEARNQGTAGRLAVMAVTINRVNDERFPNTICDVVYEGEHRKHPTEDRLKPIINRCQFSWYCDGLPDSIKYPQIWHEIYTLAEKVVEGEYRVPDITDGATHYHADYVYPSWADTKTKTIEIQDHIFYRWEQNTKKDF